MFSRESSRVLLVDDDAALLSAYERALTRRGWKVVAASSGAAAIEKLAAGEFDVILSDISMPGMTGIELLRAVRGHDLDVPVILMTGDPSVESAQAAVEYGALQYLVKPVALHLLDGHLERAVQLHGVARLKREALDLFGSGRGMLGDRAGLDARFDAAIQQLWMAFQPIVSWKARTIYAYEALLRTSEPAIRNPGEFLEVAERIGRLDLLGRTIRARVGEASATAPDGALLFVNLHASDLEDETLYAADAGLGPIASRCVLEITERASLELVRDAQSRIRDLRALGFRIAIDDLGAGYAGLSSFTQLQPDIVKLDMSLVRGIDADPQRRAIVRAMRDLCAELGMLVVSEGVETAAERDVLADLGCDLFQGYLFARPERGFPAARW
jgi:EAL domain-containing protein (putative c-di-GMP-specific phosphodiesterase class I)/ActR/RegA family two-component response regulator